MSVCNVPCQNLGSPALDCAWSGRYVWLPLWVLPLPASEPEPPVDVVVRWHDSWHATDFERPPRPRKVRFARSSQPPPAGLFGRRGTPP